MIHEKFDNSLNFFRKEAKKLLIFTIQTLSINYTSTFLVTSFARTTFKLLEV